MGIMPSEFWPMTYGELVAFSRGHQKRAKASSRIWAHLAASVINAIPAFKKKRSVSGDQLLGIQTKRHPVRGMGDSAAEHHR